MYLKSLTWEKLKKALPLLLLAVSAHLISYYLPALWRGPWRIYPKLPVDEAIPFKSGFIVFYLLAYPQWALFYLFLVSEGEPLLRKYFRADIIGKLVCGLCFILLPVSMVRPADTGTGFFGLLTEILYALDAPTRLFPSMHCFLAWIWFRAVLEAKDTGRGVKIFTGVCAVLICASTVLIKQHLFSDVIGGILLCELCLVISARWEQKKAAKQNITA